MVSPFNPRFQLIIRNNDKQYTELYKKTFDTEKELNDFILQHGKSKKGWSLLDGAFCVQRTKDKKEFYADLCLPSFVHFALKTNKVALIFFASPILLLVDLVTLPFRIVNLFKALKKKEEKHPLQDFLEKKGKTDFSPIIWLDYCKETDATSYEKVKQNVVEGSIRVLLKRFPIHVVSDQLEKNYSSEWKMEKGEWIQISKHVKRDRYQKKAWLC